MRVDVVGVPRVTGPDGAVSGGRLGGRRAHALLVALALHGGSLSAERLAELVWEGAAPPTWPAALRGVVRVLRAVLQQVGLDDQQLVATVPGGYRMADGVTVDVSEAEAVLDEARELVRAGRPRAARERLEPIGAWRGADVLPDSGAEWLQVHRHRVDELARRAWELMVEAAAAAGDHAQAVAAARQWVAVAALDERPHRALIAALDAAGDRAGAVRAFEACRTLLADELGVEPTRETVEIYLHALGDQTPHSPAPVPRPGTSFHGRRDEALVLADEVRRRGLVTVVGPAGVGKSRLAAEVAQPGRDQVLETRWVPLEAVTLDALVPATVALALGLAPGDDPVGSVVAELAPLGPLLLVLDGCEAALDGAATLAGELVERCPRLTVLATCRVPLGLQGERTHRLEPWAVPDPEDDVPPVGPAVDLLRERVRDNHGGLSVERADRAVLAGLLRHCAGLPLAIELVAAQLATVAAGDLADQLDHLLRGEHDPVRGVAASSYALLSAEEAAVFRRFAVLDGNVGLAPARAVLAGGEVTALRVVRILGQLGSYGLLRVDRSGERWRWSQDDELHRYARELLAERGEEADAFARLAVVVRDLLPPDARAAPGGYADQVTDLLASVRSLLNAAAEGRADPATGLELAFRLHRYWAATSVGEGRFWLGRLLESAGEPDGAWVPYATYALGYLEYWAGDSDRAVPRLREAAELLTGVDDQYVARALVFLAGLLDDTDQPREAVATIRRAIGIAERFGPELQMPTVMGLGSLLSERGDPEAAIHAQRAIEVCRASGDADQLRMALPTAAMICWQVGATGPARAYVDEAMPLHDAGPRIAKVVLYSAAAGLALAAGDPGAAAELAATADRDGTELGVERELPLARAISARALLELGDRVAAADRAAASLEAALTIAYPFPLAIGLETAALVIASADAGTPAQLTSLLEAAAELRRRGDRPPPATLPTPVLAAAPVSEPLDARAAARLARKILADL